MDYTAVGQTMHLAARMEQVARPGATLLTAATLELAQARRCRDPTNSLRVGRAFVTVAGGDDDRRGARPAMSW
jgi:class 3 adenylate cyclase